MDKVLKDRLRNEFFKYELYWCNSDFLKDLLIKLHSSPMKPEIEFSFLEFHRSFIDLKGNHVHPFSESFFGNDKDMLKNNFINQTEAFFGCYYVLPDAKSKSHNVRILWNNRNMEGL